jgi:hypothetical protein
LIDFFSAAGACESVFWTAASTLKRTMKLPFLGSD